jgi:predicted restriction endonuclease
MTVDDYLRSVGKKCFIDYYELFQDFNVDRQSLINELKKEKLSSASCDTKASDGRQIFIKSLEIEALQNILNSKRLDKPIKEKAQKLLNKEKIEIIYPDEIEDNDLYEGTKKQITVNAYERSSQARQECINEYGYKCVICNFDFEKIYGEIGHNFIHVHHVKPLSEIDEKYKINPIEDLRPVCPNCHAMLHKRKPAYSIEEIKDKMEQKTYNKSLERNI